MFIGKPITKENFYFETPNGGQKVFVVRILEVGILIYKEGKAFACKLPDKGKGERMESTGFYTENSFSIFSKKSLSLLPSSSTFVNG
jgi:hypothetical protein